MKAEEELREQVTALKMRVKQLEHDFSLAKQNKRELKGDIKHNRNMYDRSQAKKSELIRELYAKVRHQSSEIRLLRDMAKQYGFKN